MDRNKDCLLLPNQDDLRLGSGHSSIEQIPPQHDNGSYPGYGMNVCKPQDGSVIRVRYTLALGKDIGGFTSASGSYGVSSGNYYKEW